MADMPEISSIFNRFDFLGIIVPGYVAVILSILLFRPEWLSFAQSKDTIDLFSAVVFLVAGPTVGATLQIFHRYLYSIFSLMHRKPKESGNQETDLKDSLKLRTNQLKIYYFVRISSTPDQKSELDKVESIYDFSISTAIALLIIGGYYLIFKGHFEMLTVPIFVLSAILLVGGYFEKREGYWFLLEQLITNKFPFLVQ
jgi:hypothetical protein